MAPECGAEGNESGRDTVSIFFLQYLSTATLAWIHGHFGVPLKCHQVTSSHLMTLYPHTIFVRISSVLCVTGHGKFDIATRHPVRGRRAD